MRHRGTIAGSLLLSAGLLAAAAAAPALATTHHKGIEISTVKTKKLGRVVANEHGRVMYLFTKDGHKLSHCHGICAAAWPKVMSKAKPRGEHGVLAAHLSRTAKGQVTYYGHPLYYFASGKKAGSTVGEGLNHFFVVSIHGKAIKPKKAGGGGGTGPTGPSGPATVSTGDVGASIEVLTNDADGHTLYALDNPVEAPPQFWCVGGCTTAWIPLLTKGAPMFTGDAMSGLLSSVARPGGFDQVTYNDYPVYEYYLDTAAGQDGGEGVTGPYSPPAPDQKWYDLTPAGAFNTTA